MNMSVARLLCTIALVAAGLTPVQAQNATSGQALYDGVCRGCHGFPPSGGPESAAGNPAAITGAINSVSAMSFLRGVLSPADIADIAAYLLGLSGPPLPAHDFTDLWWNPAEPGWGLNLIQHPSNKVFGVTYTYEPPNRATWFVLPDGAWTSPLTYSGPIYRASGPPFNRPRFDPAMVSVRQVGMATLQFVDRENATFTFAVDGVAVTKNITRQPF